MSKAVGMNRHITADSTHPDPENVKSSNSLASHPPRKPNHMQISRWAETKSRGVRCHICKAVDEFAGCSHEVWMCGICARCCPEIDGGGTWRRQIQVLTVLTVQGGVKVDQLIFPYGVP